MSVRVTDNGKLIPANNNIKKDSYVGKSTFIAKRSVKFIQTVESIAGSEYHGTISNSDLLLDSRIWPNNSQVV